MAKNKKISSTETAGSSGCKEADNLKTLKKELVKSRKEIDRLRFDLTSLSASVSLLKSKNRNVVSATATAGSSQSKDIEKLKTLNNQLVTEVAENRKEIHRLRFKVGSIAADQEISDGIEQDIFRLVLSSSLDEAVARSNADMAAVMKKVNSAAAELNAAETRLMALLREKDEILMDMERIEEERDSSLRSLEKAKKTADPKPPRRCWKKWINSVAVATAAMASFFVAAAVVKDALNIKK